MFVLHLLVYVYYNDANQLVLSPRGQYSEYMYIYIYIYIYIIGISNRHSDCIETYLNSEGKTKP